MTYANREKKLKAKRESYYKHRDLILKRNKEKYVLNRVYILKRNKLYRINNKEKFKKWRKDYYNIHKNRCIAMQSAYHNARMSEDKSYKLMCLIRTRVWSALNVHLNGGKIRSSSSYGIDIKAIIDKLMKELPKDFEFGKYHVDHIIPIACFDLNNPEQLKECFKPENHQWLLAQDNLNKSDKILEEYKPLYNKLKNKLGMDKI